MAQLRRWSFLLTFLLSGVLLNAPISQAAAPGKVGAGDDVEASLKTFTRVYQLVEANFADPVDADKAIYGGAIPAMLHSLDPHSNFLAPKDYALFRENQQGHYFGVGMYISVHNNRVVVTYPFQGSPAWKAGIRPGDVVAAVDDHRTEHADSELVSSLLKGPRGTPVTVTVDRSGSDKPLIFHLIRGEVPRNSVKNAFWFRPGIAYIEIESFTETTSHEVEQSLRKLGEDSIESLIVDLRDNPGGILNEAVSIADRFLRKGQLIVYHRGRSSPESRFVAKHGNGGRNYPIVVLVNRGSASAAEILAGALQDHDRAWIVGEKTFGKGLVQGPYPLSENGALLLTIAKYYTPSGRLIQRDYSNKSSLEYYYGRESSARSSSDLKNTDLGRPVHGGDGITPDELFVEPALNRFQTALLASSALFDFTAQYFGTHSAKLPLNWRPDDALIEEFHSFLAGTKFSFDEPNCKENLTWTKQQLRLELYTTAFSKEDSERLALQTDAGLERAIQAVPRSKALLDKSAHGSTLRAAK